MVINIQEFTRILISNSEKKERRKTRMFGENIENKQKDDKFYQSNMPPGEKLPMSIQYFRTSCF